MHSAPARPRARTWDLPHARRGSPAARQGAIFFSVVNICIELSLYAVAVRFLDYRFFLL